MRSQFRQFSLVVALVATVALCAPAAATDVYQDRLPEVVEPLRCLICHLSDPDVTGDSSRNAFGDAFLANGRLWNEALASENSDGDDCSNGFELGDSDGDGENDVGVTELQTNPGLNDCSGASVNSRTWGELKALFDQK